MYYQSSLTGEQIEKAVRLVLEGKAVLITNCPNCGAPLEDGECKYCGTDFKVDRGGVDGDIH